METMINDNLGLLVYAALMVVAGILLLFFRLAWKRIDVWWTERLQTLPVGIQQLYEFAAKMAAEYVEQLVESGQLEKDINKRVAMAIEAGEKVLVRLGLKNADLDVLRIFIENYVREHLSSSGQPDPAPIEAEGVF